MRIKSKLNDIFSKFKRKAEVKAVSDDNAKREAVRREIVNIALALNKAMTTGAQITVNIEGKVPARIVLSKPAYIDDWSVGVKE